MLLVCDLDATLCFKLKPIYSLVERLGLLGEIGVCVGGRHYVVTVISCRGAYGRMHGARVRMSPLHTHRTIVGRPSSSYLYNAAESRLLLCSWSTLFHRF